MCSLTVQLRHGRKHCSIRLPIQARRVLGLRHPKRKLYLVRIKCVDRSRVLS